MSYYVRGAVFTHAIFKWNFPLWRMNESRDWPEFNCTERNYWKHWPEESPSSLAFRVLTNPFVGQERDVATMVCFLPCYALLLRLLLSSISSHLPSVQFILNAMYSQLLPPFTILRSGNKTFMLTQCLSRIRDHLILFVFEETLNFRNY